MAASHGDWESRTRFEPSEVEPRILERWLRSGLFDPAAEGTAAENYSIAIPPPNVTGALHMGHALNGSIQDALIRYHRMLGRRTRWTLGTDHAGIATQTQVEKALAREGTSREELGREEFVGRVWDWRKDYGGTIVEQLKRLGASCAYQDERFTLDEGYAEAVMRVFIDLYERGRIYRDHYMVNWDPGSRSAISDLEVEEREETDILYEIAYPLSDGSGEVVVATVRPETMLADTAVAVNPSDERHAHLIGRRVSLPLVGRELPIIGDDYVKVDFGTGALKITPGHDPNDFEIGRRHGLAQIGVIGEDGLMTEAAGEDFAGMGVLAAREAVVARLREGGLLRAEHPYTHTVPFSHRSGERIEPLISLQWFMDMRELASAASEAVRSGRVVIRPDSQRRRYEQWLAEIRPWCISRQLWWGHQLPVFYRGEETHVGSSAPEGEGWVRDPDVLDTWFSSALWPFATLGWPGETAALEAFYPTDVLVTARDILFLWVARMVMMGLEFTGEVPFSDVYVHSVIQAPDGRRMSKSLGTGIDPLQEIDRHGADALRFGLLAMSSSQDVRYSSEKVAQGQGLANKLFNASRFVAMRVDPEARPEARATAIEDRWILSRLQRAIEETTTRLEAYDFSHAALGLYDFIYGELCDWYLELVKPRLLPEAPDRGAVSSTLLHVLDRTLALAHPIVPFVTEEIWSLRGHEQLLAGGPFPRPDLELIDGEAELGLERAIGAVQALRAWRDSVSCAPRVVIPARLEAEGYEDTIVLVARMARLHLTASGEHSHATVAVPGGTVAVLAAEGLDLGAAGRERQQRRDRLQSEIARAESRLSNRGFTEKAPTAVVEAERSKLVGLRRDLEAL